MEVSYFWMEGICYFHKPECFKICSRKQTYQASWLVYCPVRSSCANLIIKDYGDSHAKASGCLPWIFYQRRFGLCGRGSSLMLDHCSKSSTPLSADTEQSENQPVIKSKSICFCYAFDSSRSESAETRTCRIAQRNLF